MSDCVFCKIAKKEIPSQTVYEDNEVIAFRDLSPQASIHVLVIPKEHFINLNDLQQRYPEKILAIFKGVQKVVEKLEIAEKGYRCVMNTNSEGGQSVYHIHLHILAGEQMGPNMAGN